MFFRCAAVVPERFPRALAAHWYVPYGTANGIRAILTIGDECLIGMGSIVMDKAVLEPRVLLGAGSLVPEGKTLQGGYLYLGCPAKQLRLLTAEELAYFDYSAKHYIELARSYT